MFFQHIFLALLHIMYVFQLLQYKIQNMKIIYVVLFFCVMRKSKTPNNISSIILLYYNSDLSNNMQLIKYISKRKEAKVGYFSISFRTNILKNKFSSIIFFKILSNCMLKVFALRKWCETELKKIIICGSIRNTERNNIYYCRKVE